MGKRDLSPGQIVFVDSNSRRSEDWIGVVVDGGFWRKAVEEEGILGNRLDDFDFDRHHPLRVLGTKTFELYQEMPAPLTIEPDRITVAHYRFGNCATAITPLDLRPLVDIFKGEEKIISELFFGGDTYVREVVRDAEIIYAYLDGERYTKDRDSPFRRDEFLKLLEQAIPIN